MTFSTGNLIADNVKYKIKSYNENSMDLCKNESTTYFKQNSDNSILIFCHSNLLVKSLNISTFQTKFPIIKIQALVIKPYSYSGKKGNIETY